MKKIVCDRCGAEIERFPNLLKRYVYICNVGSCYEDHFDLCGNCYKKLKRFLKNKPEEEEESDEDA